MFKLTLKKEKKAKLSDLREKDISPKKDWRFVLYVFIGWIIFCFVFIGLVFFTVMKGDISSPGESLTQEQITISETRLQNAVKFIESRSASNN